MHKVVVEKPYAFVPPYPGIGWPAFMQRFARARLRRKFGLVSVTCRGLEHLERSRRAGHGILLAPNHCRPADPFVVFELARQAGVVPYTMASAHLFAHSKVQAWLLERSGVFSVYREGVDRQAVGAAIDILTEAKRPLVIFPEGVITRANERLSALMDGTAFIARSAAKRRAAASPPGAVVVHPVALRYTFRGDVADALEPALRALEARLGWAPQHGLALPERVVKVGAGLLGLKEVEQLGAVQSGTIEERVERLIDHLLVPLEREWAGGKREPTVVGRVKRLRAAVLPAMVAGEVSDAERERRWAQLEAMYLAQQLWCYPPGYVRSRPTRERLLETVERFEEDLNDECRIYRPMSVTVRVGEAIHVPPQRDRTAAEDPVMAAIEAQLEAMIAAMSEPGPAPGAEARPTGM